MLGKNKGKTAKQKLKDAEDIKAMIRNGGGMMTIAAMVEASDFTKEEINSGDAPRKIRRMIHSSPGIKRLKHNRQEKFALA